MAQKLPRLFSNRVWQLTRSTALAAALIALGMQTAHAGITVDYSQLPPAPVASPAMPAVTPEGYRQIIRLHSPIARQNFQSIATPVELSRTPIVLRPPAQKIVLIPPPALGQSTAVASTLAAVPSYKRDPANHVPAAKTQIARVTTTQSIVEPAELPQTIIQSLPRGPAQLSVWQHVPMPNTLIQWPMANMLDPSGASNFPPVLPATPAQIIIEARVINADRRKGMHGAKPPIDAVAIPLIEPPMAADTSFVPPPMMEPGSVFASNPADRFAADTDITAPQPSTVIANNRPATPAYKHADAPPQAQIKAPAATYDDLPPMTGNRNPSSIYSVDAEDHAALPKTIIHNASPRPVVEPQNNIAPLPRTTIYNPDLPPLSNPPGNYRNDSAVDAPQPQAAITPIIKSVNRVAEAPVPQAQINIDAAPAPRMAINRHITKENPADYTTPDMATVLARPAENIISAPDTVPAPQTRIAMQAKPVTAPLPVVSDYILPADDVPAPRTSIAGPALSMPVPITAVSNYIPDADAAQPRTVISSAAVRPKAGMRTPQVQVQQENIAPPHTEITAAAMPVWAQETPVDMPVATPRTNIALAAAPNKTAPNVASVITRSPVEVSDNTALNADVPAQNTAIRQPMKMLKPVSEQPLAANALEALAAMPQTQVINLARPVAQPPKPAVMVNASKPVVIADEMAAPAATRIARDVAMAAPIKPVKVIAAPKVTAEISKNVPSVMAVEAPPVKPVDAVIAQPTTAIAATTIKPAAILAKNSISPPPVKTAPASMADINAQIAASEASIASLNHKLGAPNTTISQPAAITVEPKKIIQIVPVVQPVMPAALPQENTLPAAITANEITTPAAPSLTSIEAQIAATEASVAALNQKLDTDSRQAARVKPGKQVANKKTAIANAVAPENSNAANALATANYTEMMARLQETEATLAKLKADNVRLNDQVTSQQVDQDAVQVERTALMARLSNAEKNLNTLEQERTELKTAPQLPVASQKSLDAAMGQRLAQSQNTLKTIAPNTEKVIGGPLPEAQIFKLPTMEEAPAATVVNSTGAARPTPVLTRQAMQYASGVSQLDDRQNQTVDGFANQLKQNPALQLVIRTYGSNGGAASDARRLALSRASALQAALKARGVAANQLQIQAIGVPPQAQLADQAEFLVK